jgi:hypothetical protein
VLDCLIQAKLRNGGRDKRRQKLDEGQTILKTLGNGQRLTAGFLCANGVHSLGNQSLPAGVQIWLSKDDAKAKTVYRNDRNELLGRIDVVRKISKIKARHVDAGRKQMQTLNLQYKKKKGDAAMPKGTSLLRQKCQEVTSDNEMSDSVLFASNASDKGEQQGDNNRLIAKLPVGLSETI